MNHTTVATESDIIRMAHEHLPDLVTVCNQEAPLVIINQRSFGTSDEDMLRLAVSIKYAGLMGKNVSVIL